MSNSLPRPNSTNEVNSASANVIAALEAAKDGDAVVHGTAWPSRHIAPGTVGEPLALAPCAFGDELRPYSEDEVEKGAGIVYALATTTGGWTDAATTAVWGLSLDSDGSPDHTRLTEALRGSGIGYVVQVRGQKFHAHILFSAPIGSEKWPKPEFRKRVRFALEKLGELAGVAFDLSKADALATLVYCYTRRPGDSPTVETLAHDGAAIDFDRFLQALGYADGEPEAIRANTPSRDSAPAMSTERVRALIAEAAQESSFEVPKPGGFPYEEKRRVTTLLARRAIELAGAEATAIDRDELVEALCEHLGDRLHIPALVASAVDRAFGERKAEVVARDARILAMFKRNGDASAASSEPAAPVELAPTYYEVLASPEFRAPLVAIPTGIHAFDEKTNGLITKTITTIAGAPGSGKTQLAKSWAMHAAGVGHAVLFATLEMTAPEIAARIVSPILDETALAVLQQRVPHGRVLSAADRALPFHLFRPDFRKQGTLTDQIRGQMIALNRRYAAGGKAALLVVDYLQLGAMLASKASDDGFRLQVDGLLYGLIDIAQDHCCAVLLVSSVGRDDYKGLQIQSDNPLDKLGSSKESGGVEFASVTLVHIETSPLLNAVGERDVKLTIPKARYGTVGHVGLRFRGATGTFTEDADALRRMSADGKSDRDCDALMAYIEKHGPQTKEHLRTRVLGLKGKRATGAIERCLDAGRLRPRKLQGMDAIGRQTKTLIYESTEAPAGPFAPLGKGGKVFELGTKGATA